MEPYIIRQGDTLAKLAYKFGFDVDTIWNDDKNAELRKLRSDPNLLWPTDVVYIPDQTDKQPDKTLVTGATNSFASDAPTTTITLKFLNPQLASQPCTIAELDHLTDLATTGDGVLTFAAPVTLDTATVAFSAISFTYSCNIGYLDPIGTLSGIYQRLQNLGYLDDGLEPDATQLDLVRGGLRALKMSKSGPPVDAASDESPDASPSAAPPSSASSDSTSPPDSGGGDASAEPGPSDGLSDDGVLDEDTSQQLLAAHGC